jgi:hypothetical protein
MMPKGQLKFLIGYCVFMLLLTQYLQHIERHRAMLEPLAALLGSLLPICISAFAIKNGWALGRLRAVDRDESPVNFWLLVALGFGIGAYLIFQGLRGLALLS